MGPIGIPEMIFIFVVALLIFGPKKLPELGRSFGKGVSEFRKASSELRATFQREMDAIDRETEEVKNMAADVRKDVKSTYYDDGGDHYSDYDNNPYEGDSTVKTAKTAPPSPAAVPANEPDKAAGSPAAASPAAGPPDTGPSDTESDSKAAPADEDAKADASQVKAS